MKLRFITPLVGSLLLGSPALSCGFHGYSPQPAFVDRLLASEHVVLARNQDDNPFRYTQITVLEGSDAHVEIPYLVDSTTRQRMAEHPEDKVLFVRDGPYGPWVQLAYVDAAMSPVIEGVMANLPQWEVGPTEDRFAFFAQLLHHPDPDVHYMALQELDQAPYGQLRRLPLSIEPDRLLATYGSISETNLRSIRIILLGLGETQDTKLFLREGMQQYLDAPAPLLGAFATALIEQGGADTAIAMIETHLADDSLLPDTRELLVEAMAIHSASGDTDTSAAIRHGLAAAVRREPSLAMPIARQFGARYDWSLRAVLSEMMQHQDIASPFDKLLLAQYVAAAQSSANQIQN